MNLDLILSDNFWSCITSEYLGTVDIKTIHIWYKYRNRIFLMDFFL